MTNKKSFLRNTDFNQAVLIVTELVTEDIEDTAACQALAIRLEEQLRAAKTAQLACGEVLLPADLLPRVARDVLRMAENEPCGLR